MDLEEELEEDKAAKKLRLKEFSDVLDGTLYRSRAKVFDDDLVAERDKLRSERKPVPPELQKKLEDSGRHDYILAERYNGEGGFTLRAPGRRYKSGEVGPPTVTGGGANDRVCKDLLDGHLFVERAKDFGDKWQRIDRRSLPPALKNALPREMEPESLAE